VVNAADAVEGGGRIDILTRRVALADGEVSGVSAGDYVAVSVADTGPGMSPEVMQRAFEPFFTTKDVGKGTGLGLAQVYGFMSQCGGTVTIDSAPGEGATVTLYVPAIDAVPHGGAPRRANRRQLGGGRRDPAGGGRRRGPRRHREPAAGDGLHGDGPSATEIDGPSAMARLKTSQAFDLLISDIVMPGGMNGVELARWTHNRPRPGLPIVLTTGYAGDQFADGSEEITWPVVRKPFRAEQLSAAVREALTRVTP
jgi:CheY-like chemotaxis protein